MLVGLAGVAIILFYLIIYLPVLKIKNVREKKKQLAEFERIDKIPVPELKKIWKKEGNDNQSLLKKYIDYSFLDNIGPLEPYQQHHNDTIDRIDNYEREENFKQTGLRMTDWELEEHTKKVENEKRLIKKYGKETAGKIINEELWFGMTKDMLQEVKGNPSHKIEKMSRGKKREEFFYRAYTNRLGKDSYRFRVVVINDEVDGWNDIN